MKFKVMMMSVVMFATVSVFAQKSGRSEMAQKRMEKMTEELNLTPEQKTKIEAINLEFKEAMKPLRADKEANAEAIAKLRKEHKEKMQSVFTPEQKKKMETLREERRQKGQAMRTEIEAYKSKNIDPILKEKRQLLENELSETEKKTIAEQRLKWQNGKAQAKVLRDEFKAAKMRGETVDHSKMEDLRKQNKVAKKEMKEALKPIVKKHEKTLATIKESLEPSKVIWEKDIAAIKAKYPEIEHKKEMRSAKHGDKGPKNTKKEGAKKGENKEGEEGKGNHKELHFLLMDPK